MVEWWNNLGLKDVVAVFVFLHLLGVAFHLTSILIKVRIFRGTKVYLEAAREEQDKMDGVLVEIREAMVIVKGWASLARMEASNSRELSKVVNQQVSDNAARLENKIDQVPEKVVEKIEQKSGDSSVNKIPTVPKDLL